MASKPAPGELETVRRFVNTWHFEERWDLLDTPARATEWFRDSGLIPEGTRLGEDERVRAVELREAIRTMLLANNGDAVAGRDPETAIEVLNGTCRRAGVSPVFGGSTVDLIPSEEGINGALGRLVAITATSMGEGTWGRLKACAADDCLWAFYDHARNHSGRWCEMAVCGNRKKVRTYRRRAAEGADPS